jgi:chemotaxis response regulator CheB
MTHISAVQLLSDLAARIAELNADPAPNQVYAATHDRLTDTDRATATRLGLNPDDCELIMWVACGWTVESMADTYLGRCPVYYASHAVYR